MSLRKIKKTATLTEAYVARRNSLAVLAGIELFELLLFKIDLFYSFKLNYSKKMALGACN
jgi:hypothetical protein